jgi:hypothetical protein
LILTRHKLLELLKKKRQGDEPGAFFHGLCKADVHPIYFLDPSLDSVPANKRLTLSR